MTREEAKEYIYECLDHDEAAEVIKALEQESILDKIRAEIERQEKWLMDAGYNQYNVDIALDTMKSVVDKCKAETEDT